MAIAWSYSSLKTFQQCPKKYYHLKVAKDVQEADNEATTYGKAVHKAAEDYVSLGTPIPPQFAFITPVVSALKDIPGEKLCEKQLAVTQSDDDYEPCGFFDKKVWYRGIADLLIIRDEDAYLVDYKTSKNAKYADVKQLDLLAGAVFTHYPNIKRIKSALIFVVSNEFIEKEHVADNRLKYLNYYKFDVSRIEKAIETGVWNAVSGPLCGWCPVKSCPNFRERRK
jgi:hypothetical protein